MYIVDPQIVIKQIPMKPSQHIQSYTEQVSMHPRPKQHGASSGKKYFEDLIIDSETKHYVTLKESEEYDLAKYNYVYKHVKLMHSLHPQKKRYSLSPNKLVTVNFEGESKYRKDRVRLAKQIERLRVITNMSRRYQRKEISSFSSVKDPAVRDLEARMKASELCDKLSGKELPYQCYKKKSLMMATKEKLKPIMSDTLMINMQETDFLNVYKMYLLELDKKKLLLAPIDSKQSSISVSKKSLMPKRKLVQRLYILNEKYYPYPNTHVFVMMAYSYTPVYKYHYVRRMLCVKGIDKLQFMYPQTSKIRKDRYYMNSVKALRKTTYDACVYEKEVSRDYSMKNDVVMLSFRKNCEEGENYEEKVKAAVKMRSRNFAAPFYTYHYRDLLWKVNMTNSMHIETPIEYEHRLRVFVGRGNNSCLVSGLIKRRHWFGFTDNIEYANFVWTQLKQLSYFKVQQRSTRTIIKNNNDYYQPKGILLKSDYKCYHSYFTTYRKSEYRTDYRLLSRYHHFQFTTEIKASQIRNNKMQNHLINNYVIGNKKALFNTMSNYYLERKEEVFNYLPLTFHIKDGIEDYCYYKFLKYYYQRAKYIARTVQYKGKKSIREHNVWIVKPGENSNRGRGIQLCLTLEYIKTIIKRKYKYQDGSPKTYIIQAYIERPMLYHKRKFDLRHYIMMTSVNGIIKGYWYRDGYVRTTSSEYNLNCNLGSVHLTNDAVQKNLPNYGKFEKGNKISYYYLDGYIYKRYRKNGIFYGQIYPKMKKIATDAMRACSGGIDPDKLCNNFEVFGMDFMIDYALNVWLIEINSNPCLEISCPLLGTIIPKMVENCLELTLDAMFPPPVRYTPKGMHYRKNLYTENRFELVFDERKEVLCTGSLEVLDKKLLEEYDDTFEDDGGEWYDQDYD